MAPVLGRPFLEWVVRFLAAQGIGQFILSTGYRGDVVARHFRTHPVGEVRVRCVPETEPLGTAGGFLNAVKDGADPPPAWLVLNGDSLVLAPLAPLLSALSEPAVSGALLGVRMTDASRYGTIREDAQGALLEFAEKRPGAGVINAGVYLFRSAALDWFPRKAPLSFEKEVFPELIARGMRLQVCASEAPFLDIGTPESLVQAERFIGEHRNWFSDLGLSSGAA